jgi:formylglycine-generating enzyme required for sulfatase activity
MECPSWPNRALGYWVGWGCALAVSLALPAAASAQVSPEKVGAPKVTVSPGERKPGATAAPPAKETGRVAIPAGKFFMGCNDVSDTDCDDDEKPGRMVMTEPFKIDRTEVTVTDYRACFDAKACSEPGLGVLCTWGRKGREGHPVNCVTWQQAKSYCEWTHGRLPTEAEWEKAARGTDARVWPWGAGNVSCQTANVKGCRDETATAGTLIAGATSNGLLDMAGNVWEWTADNYEREKALKIAKGGAWTAFRWSARTSARRAHNPTGQFVSVGFRCVE